MKIVIPSFARSDQIVKKTLNVLKDVSADIYVFVVEEELEEYKKAMDERIHLIVGEKGLANQRNFITNFFDEGEVIISMDDDIEEVHIKSGRSLQNILEECCDYLKENDGIIGFPPTYNKFWNKAEGFKKGLYYIVGAFFIFKNDRIQVTKSIGEDFERSIKYFEKYGYVSRCNDLIYKTKYYTNKGGMMEEGRNVNKIYSDLTKLYYKYPHLLKIRTKKLKEEVVNLSIKKSEIPKVMILPKINIFNDLEKMMIDSILIKTSGSKKGAGSRTNFPVHYRECFGYVQRRFKKKNFELSVASIKYPHIYEELKRIGNIICPFEFKSIHVLKNCVCPKHKDSKNSQKSVLISFGDYTGCNLVIEDNIYDAKHTPILFDGRIMEHWNTPDLVGTKYSLIFY
jgi:hypothetical protein